MIVGKRRGVQEKRKGEGFEVMLKWLTGAQSLEAMVQLEAIRTQLDELRELICRRLEHEGAYRREIDRQWDRFWAYTGNEQEAGG